MLLEDVLPSVAISNDSVSASLLFEMLLLGDCLDSDSQLRASLARLDGAKKLRMFAIAHHSDFPHVCADMRTGFGGRRKKTVVGNSRVVAVPDHPRPLRAHPWVLSIAVGTVCQMLADSWLSTPMGQPVPVFCRGAERLW